MARLSSAKKFPALLRDRAAKTDSSGDAGYLLQAADLIEIMNAERNKAGAERKSLAAKLAAQKRKADQLKELAEEVERLRNTNRHLRDQIEMKTEENTALREWIYATDQQANR